MQLFSESQQPARTNIFWICSHMKQVYWKNHITYLHAFWLFISKEKKTNDNMQKKLQNYWKTGTDIIRRTQKPSFIQWTRIRTSNQESVKGKFEGTMSWKCWVGPVNVSFVELERVDRNLSNSSLGGFEVFAN